MSEDVFHCHKQAGAKLHSEEKPKKLPMVPQEKMIRPSRTLMLCLGTAVLQLCEPPLSQLCGLLVPEQL